MNEDNEIEVIGIGSHPSKGLSRGVVVNIESTVRTFNPKSYRRSRTHGGV